MIDTVKTKQEQEAERVLDEAKQELTTAMSQFRVTWPIRSPSDIQPADVSSAVSAVVLAAMRVGWNQAVRAVETGQDAPYK